LPSISSLVEFKSVLNQTTCISAQYLNNFRKKSKKVEKSYPKIQLQDLDLAKKEEDSMPQQTLKGFKQVLTQAESFLARLREIKIGLNLSVFISTTI